MLPREFELTRGQFDWIRRFAKARAGINLTEAKFDLVYSRLTRRLRALRMDAFAPYLERLESGDEDEIRELLNALTTNVTSFFREPHHFDHLAQLRQPEGSTRPFKVWSCASSTGEEPYSIAMTLLDAGVKGHRILASDLDTAVLRTAREGWYRREKTTGLGSERLRRWFAPGRGDRTGWVQAKPELRERMMFHPINLMERWPIRGPVDAIFCRNVLIYFDRSTQVALFHRFADLLVPGGHLYLGHSESLHDEPRLRIVGRTIYQRVGR